MPTIKLQQLQMLHALSETGSLKGAAEQLHRTSAAVSMALKKLEDEVGFTLFDRDGYRLKLTAYGEQFLRQAREVLRQQQRLQSLTQLLRDGAEPQLRITYDYTCSPHDLFPAMQQMQQQFPATELLFSGASQLRGLKHVRDGDVELALSPWLPIFRQYGDFETIPVRPFEIYVVAAPQLIGTTAEHCGAFQISREDLFELPMLMPQNQEFGLDLDSMMRVPSQQRIRVNDSITQRELLLAGMGWGIIPADLVADALATGALQRLDIPGFMSTANLEVHLIRSAERLAGPAEEVIWQHFCHSQHLS